MTEHSLSLDYLENCGVRGQNCVLDAVLFQHFTRQ